METVTKGMTWLQPVASAHAAGVKMVENRSWRPTTPTPFLLGLHAGNRWWRGPSRPARSRPDSARPDSEGMLFCRERWPGMPMSSEIPHGAILGAVSVCRVVALPALELEGEPWALGPVCWLIDRVWVLDEPIARPGMLGLWDLTDNEAMALTTLVQRPPTHRRDWSTR